MMLILTCNFVHVQSGVHVVVKLSACKPINYACMCACMEVNMITKLNWILVEILDIN